MKTKPKPQAVELKIKVTDTDVSPAVNLARNVATVSNVHAVAAMQPWLLHTYGVNPDMGELMDTLKVQTAAMRGGKTDDIESMLFDQAITLQTIFTALSRRAAGNVGENMHAVDLYMRLALKTQSQCRATLETLSEIKNPRSVAFVRQANIAQNQQVNNGAESTLVAPSPAREKTEILPNKLLTEERTTHGTTLDARSKATAGKRN